MKTPEQRSRRQLLQAAARASSAKEMKKHKAKMAEKHRRYQARRNPIINVDWKVTQFALEST